MSAKLERVIRIDTLIRTTRYPNARSIADEFEVSEPTAYEDYSFLKERLNAPIEYDPERGGWYYTEPNWALPAFIATEGELLAFLLSTEVASSYLGSGFEDILRKATSSLAQSLPGQVRLDLSALAAHYSFSAGATITVNPRLLAALNGAIQGNHPVEVTYYTASRGARGNRVLTPMPSSIELAPRKALPQDLRWVQRDRGSMGREQAAQAPDHQQNRPDPEQHHRHYAEPAMPPTIAVSPCSFPIRSCVPVVR